MRVQVNIAIPKNWFVYALIHNHSACNYRDVLHSPGNWSAELQHIVGGCLVKATGETPQAAMQNAIKEIKRCKEERIWYGKVVQGISVYDEEEDHGS